MLYPKIGIRPVIDGRWGGVRESLENQTMRMAENAAKLISENLKYPDGTPVQCVIGCTTIGGGAEAARVAEQFSTQNVTATLSVTPCWCYGTETFDMDGCARIAKRALIRTSVRTCRLSSRSRKLFRPTRIGSLSSR